MFSGGIGQHAPPVRSQICRGLEFLGMQIDESRNDANAAIVSTDAARVCVRVIPTDEELMMARIAFEIFTRT